MDTEPDQLNEDELPGAGMSIKEGTDDEETVSKENISEAEEE